MDKREQLLSYAIRYKGNWTSIARALAKKEPWQECAERENYITIYDDAYPDVLRQLRFPPWILFYKGNIRLLKNRMCAVVGSREACEYGRMATEWIVESLSEKYTIVSGMAKGIDACAHETAIRLGGPTVGVIGSGLGTQYPAVNKELYGKMEGQLLITEYPYDTGVRKEHFPWRNRIISALGNPVFVTQAAMHSGTMLTVNEAIQLSREVYCIPYPIGNKYGEGCNTLIDQGAMILHCTEQLQDLLTARKSSTCLQK